MGIWRCRSQQRHRLHDGIDSPSRPVIEARHSSEANLVVCSWDGEEIGLTGSTEWGEQFADELRKKAVAYINVDSSTSGPNLDGSAVASLAPMLVETSDLSRSIG